MAKRCTVVGLRLSSVLQLVGLSASNSFLSSNLLIPFTGIVSNGMPHLISAGFGFLDELPIGYLRKLRPFVWT